MRKHLGIALMVSVILGIAGIGMAGTTITFDELTPGSSIPISPGIVYPDVTFTYIGGGSNFYVQNPAPGPPLSGNVILGGYSGTPGEAFKATFTSFSSFFDVWVDMGDFNGDDDYLYLKAFDSSNNLLASDFAINPASVNGGLTLQVHTGTPIAYLLFYEDLTVPGSIYIDNFTYGPTGSVPEPSTFLLLASGLAGLGGIVWRRKRQS
jgi:hypothetical protein